LTLIATTIDALTRQLRDLQVPTTAQQMLETETRRRALALAIADLRTAEGIIRAHKDKKLREQAAAEARQRFLDDGITRRIENKGWSSVTLTLAGGLRLKMTTPYLRPTRKGLRGRRRGSGKGQAGGVGAYPVLERLGFEASATPLCRSIVSRHVVLCSSYAEAREQLGRDGLGMDTDQMVRLATHSGQRALELRDEALAAALRDPLPEHSMVAGQRIRFSVDGGRARTRRTNRLARKQENGRRPFLLDWREPRVITIDVLDERGEQDRRWRPIYEVSLGDADRVFELLCGLLRLIGAHKARQIVFVCDGAEWIWKRAEELFARAEVPRDRVELVLDYYHATEHIADALKACKNLRSEQRAAFVRLFSKELLSTGGPESMIAKLRGFARGQRSKAMNKEIDYLVGHLEAGRLRYAELRALALPIGSGVVEATVRRVINLRFKSASQCWCEETVKGERRLEGLMYLRAILKSDRWDEAMTAQLAGRHFLAPMTPACSGETLGMGNAA
jgi:hypothetical protein